MDATHKNVLHHAVINKCKDIIGKLVVLDADKSLLRQQKDCKNKTPS